jgi:hypothetical protein
MNHTETFSLHPSIAGLVIGRGGCNFKVVTEKSCTKLFYDKKSQIVTIKGKTFANCDKAKTILTKLVKHVKTRQAEFQKGPIKSNQGPIKRNQGPIKRNQGPIKSNQVIPTNSKDLTHLVRFSSTGGIRSRKQERQDSRRFDTRIQTLYNAHKQQMHEMGKWPIGYWIFRERTISKLIEQEKQSNVSVSKQEMTDETLNWLSNSKMTPITSGVWGNSSGLSSIKKKETDKPVETPKEETTLFTLNKTSLSKHREEVNKPKPFSLMNGGFIRKKDISESMFFDNRNDEDEYDYFDEYEFDLDFNDESNGFDIDNDEYDSTVFC